jgi:release factor glutamine methyltransferase
MMSFMTDEARLLKEKYGGVHSAEFLKDCGRLQNGEPLAYVIGTIPFLDTIIHLDSRPLIPRAETEFWTERAIAAINRSGRNEPAVLDLCAGSGAIGIAVAKAIPAAQVTFAELEKKHLPTIEKNLDANGISCTCYKVFASDLFENVPGTFDFILSNPPYIDPAIDRAEESVKRYEPYTALYGGAHGMELIERIVIESPMHVRNGGQLWIEHEPEQVTRIHELAREHSFVVSTCKDQYGVDRYSILTK